MWDTAGEVRTISYAMYSSGPLHMNEQRQDDQLEPTYKSVPIQDVALKTSPERWTIEILWNFDIKTNHQISSRQPRDSQTKKKKQKQWNYRIVDFSIPADHRIKLKEDKKRNKNSDFTRELKKTMEDENDGDTEWDWKYEH